MDSDQLSSTFYNFMKAKHQIKVQRWYFFPPTNNHTCVRCSFMYINIWINILTSSIVAIIKIISCQ